jgi:hypothetical protein
MIQTQQQAIESPPQAMPRNGPFWNSNNLYNQPQPQQQQLQVNQQQQVFVVSWKLGNNCHNLLFNTCSCNKYVINFPAAATTNGHRTRRGIWTSIRGFAPSKFPKLISLSFL